ncbi:hypothetical protein CB1_001731004 [Camelus ferus]|nr:hypothetical protein CB1_001731004 [Camelus ferus]
MRLKILGEFECQCTDLCCDMQAAPRRTSLRRWADSLKGFQVGLYIPELTENVAINLSAVLLVGPRTSLKDGSIPNLLQPKAEVTSPSSDMNTTRDCPSPSASHNKPSDETSNPSSEGSFRGPLKLQLGSPDPGTHFCIVWASPGWDTDNPGFLL